MRSMTLLLVLLIPIGFSVYAETPDHSQLYAPPSSTISSASVWSSFGGNNLNSAAITSAQAVAVAIVQGTQFLVDDHGKSLLFDDRTSKVLFDASGSPKQILECAYAAALRQACILGALLLCDRDGKSLLFDYETETFIFDTTGTPQEILSNAKAKAQELGRVNSSISPSPTIHDSSGQDNATFYWHRTSSNDNQQSATFTLQKHSAASIHDMWHYIVHSDLSPDAQSLMLSVLCADTADDVQYLLDSRHTMSTVQLSDALKLLLVKWQTTNRFLLVDAARGDIEALHKVKKTAPKNQVVDDLLRIVEALAKANNYLAHNASRWIVDSNSDVRIRINHAVTHRNMTSIEVLKLLVYNQQRENVARILDVSADSLVKSTKIECLVHAADSYRWQYDLLGDPTVLLSKRRAQAAIEAGMQRLPRESSDQIAAGVLAALIRSQAKKYNLTYEQLDANKLFQSYAPSANHKHCMRLLTD